MGFGYLFLGYLFFFNVAYAGYTNLFAVLLMLLGLSSLKQYARHFSSAFYTGLPLLAISLFSFVGEMLKLLDFAVLPDVAFAFANILFHLFAFAFMWAVLTGVIEIATETSIPVLVARAMRNRLFVPFFYVLAALTETDTVFGSYSVYFVMARLLFGLVFTFLCAKCFFECYVWICLEGDENMDSGRSRFGFINKLNAISARADEKTLARKKAEREAKDAKRREKEKKKK